MYIPDWHHVLNTDICVHTHIHIYVHVPLLMCKKRVVAGGWKVAGGWLWPAAGGW